MAGRSVLSKKSELALLAALLAGPAPLGCQTRASTDTALTNGAAQPAASTKPLETAARFLGSPLPSATAAPAPSAEALPSAPPSVAPIPSLIEGHAACDACLEAARAGRYLTPQGVGHYLVGCDDAALRAHCLAATKRSLPAHAKKLASGGNCPEARKLAEFANRSGADSPALHSALASCQNP